jgi:hypothetical protein
MSTAPRVPRIPARGPVDIRPDPRPHWYESTALRLALLASIGIVGALVVYVWRQILGWFA